MSTTNFTNSGTIVKQSTTKDKIKPDTLAKLAQIQPNLQAIPGLQAVQHFRTGDHLVTHEIWSDRQAMQQGTQHPLYRQQFSQLQEITGAMESQELELISSNIAK